MLGGELIRRRCDDDALARKPGEDALRELIEGGGGPLMWPRISESEQDSLGLPPAASSVASGAGRQQRPTPIDASQTTPTAPLPGLSGLATPASRLS
jgi:hypothetical protein